MRKFDNAFREDLRKAVESVESTSGVELVATIMPRAAGHWHLYLLCGLIPSFLVLTIMMFIPTEFWYVLIYLETVGTLLLGAALPWVVPGLARMLLGQKARRKAVTRASRALFQEAGMVETRERIGVLIVFAWFEREAVIIPDRGAEELVPPDEWETMTRTMCAALRGNDAPASILDALNRQKGLFQTYIPREPNDINELPDELWLH